MALHQDRKATFLNATCGKLAHGRRESRETFSAVDGLLVSLSLHDGEYNGKPKTELWIELMDGEDRYLVSSTHPTTFTYMFARHLKALRRGDRIKLDVWLVDGQDKVTACKVSLLTEDGEWSPVPDERKHHAGTVSREERLRAASTWLRDHEAFSKAETTTTTADDTLPPGEVVLYGRLFERPTPEALSERLGPDRVGTLTAHASKFGEWDPLTVCRVAARGLGIEEPVSLERTPRKLATLALALMDAHSRFEDFDRDAFAAHYDSAKVETERGAVSVEEYDPFEKD